MTNNKPNKLASNKKLLENLEYKLILHKKTNKIPAKYKISQVYSMCAADLDIAEGKNGLIILDKKSSLKYIRSNKQNQAIEELRKNCKNQDELEVLDERIDGCDKYRYYLGLGKRKIDLKLREVGIKADEEDSLDQKPYLVIGNLKSFKENKIKPDEIKLLIPISIADQLFGYKNKPHLKGLKNSEIKQYLDFRNNPPKSGQAFCRQTSAKIYGTFGNNKKIDLNFAQICQGARIRTTILFTAGDCKTFLDPQKLFLISFSRKRFEELFGLI